MLVLDNLVFVMRPYSYNRNLWRSQKKVAMVSKSQFKLLDSP